MDGNLCSHVKAYIYKNIQVHVKFASHIKSCNHLCHVLRSGCLEDEHKTIQTNHNL
jgi:hypothetical protein